MLFDDFECNVRILTVLKLSWTDYDSHTPPRKYHALSFRLKGNAHYSYSGGELDIYSGETVFVPQNLGYHISAEDEELYVIHFELPEKSQDILEPFHTADSTQLRRLFASCYDTWSKKEPGYYFRTLSIFYHILELLNILSIDTSPDNDNLQIKPAIDYLHMNFSDPDISVQKLCKLVYMSDTWFRKLFSQLYGTTPVKYINQLRINQAKELIESGYYSVEQIAELVGFSDSKYFSTVFRHHTGYSPSEYKKKGYENV